MEDDVVMVKIPKSEYDKLVADSRRVAELEKKNDDLTNALVRLTQLL